MWWNSHSVGKTQGDIHRKRDVLFFLFVLFPLCFLGKSGLILHGWPLQRWHSFLHCALQFIYVYTAVGGSKGNVTQREREKAHCYMQFLNTDRCTLEENSNASMWPERHRQGFPHDVLHFHISVNNILWQNPSQQPHHNLNRQDDILDVITHDSHLFTGSILDTTQFQPFLWPWTQSTKITSSPLKNCLKNCSLPALGLQQRQHHT